jgi:hypothetical protein
MLIPISSGAWIDSRAHIAISVPEGNRIFVHVCQDGSLERLGPFSTLSSALKEASDIAEKVNDARAKERAALGRWD